MIPLPLLFRGKVRDVYEAPDGHLLLVASDRVSAFDVVMAERVPGKGRVLTQITAWWLSTHLPRLPHHLVSVRPGEIRRAVPALEDCDPCWEGRATLVRRTRPLPVECVVRGYLSGSAWKEYGESGTLAGEALADGLVESGALVPAIFSPATKATDGHDENITFARMAEIVGADLAGRLRERSLGIYERGRAAAAARGIILADTKFEFGIADDGELLLIDEVLTPDSSRFWPKECYRAGRGQPSLDKQPVRDYLESLDGWNKRYPPPPLPARVVEATAERYRDVFRRLTGTELDEYAPPRFDGRGVRRERPVAREGRAR